VRKIVLQMMTTLNGRLDGWHSLRRRFATDLDHLPLTHLMNLGGWRTPTSAIRYRSPPPRSFGRGRKTRRGREGFRATGQPRLQPALQRSPAKRSTRVAIRPAAPADLPALGRLGARLVRTHHQLDAARFIPATPGTEHAYASFLGAQLQEPTAVVLIAERDGDVLGYAYAAVEGHDYRALRGPAGVLHDIVVDPAHRRQGVGRMLLDATLASLDARGAPRVVLSTAARNEAAQRLFAGVGFRQTMVEMTRECDTWKQGSGQLEE
jgi:ribosomal protein S18 acetylase RimI-like enzyme